MFVNSSLFLKNNKRGFQYGSKSRKTLKKLIFWGKFIRYLRVLKEICIAAHLITQIKIFLGPFTLDIVKSVNGNSYLQQRYLWVKTFHFPSNTTF